MRRLNLNKTISMKLVCLTLTLGMVSTACQPEKSSSAVDANPVITINWQVDEVISEEISTTKPGHFSSAFHLTEYEVTSSQSYIFTLKKSLDELDQVELLQDAKTLLSATLYQSSLVGLCLNQANLSPVFFIHSVDEGIGIDYQHLWAQDPQQQWQVISLPDSDSYMADNIVCTDKQYSHWADYQRHPNSEPCRCDFQQDIFGPTEQERWLALLPQQVNVAEPFAGQLFENQNVPLTLHLIDDQKAISLLIEHALLAPEYESSVSTHAAIRFVNLVNVQGLYQNIGYSFIQKDGLWHLWTIAGDSSKGFHPITDIQQQNDGLIHLQMCVADCAWWGKQALVALDLQALSIKVIEER